MFISQCYFISEQLAWVVISFRRNCTSLDQLTALLRKTITSFFVCFLIKNILIDTKDSYFSSFLKKILNFWKLIIFQIQEFIKRHSQTQDRPRHTTIHSCIFFLVITVIVVTIRLSWKAFFKGRDRVGDRPPTSLWIFNFELGL